jgi:diaminohydroxyphosphoribosylaminopyrimidine deaminase / 5-amino-6-(5-phosphoribosylamino)uracil reductase
MRAALTEARKGVGKTSPNPAVGAVLVIGNRVVARGHHQAAGKPHAEIECLRAWNKPLPRGAVLYVTLEPCSTVGRTPACTDALIRSGLQTLVVGAIDPDPRHHGHGIDLLKAAGMEVRAGVLAHECKCLNEGFEKWIVTRKPFVIAKCGMTLDGRITKPPNETRWITSPAARRHAHHLRAQVDAILIGAETLRTDNPRLTVRGRRGTKQPLRVVMTRSGKLPRAARLFQDRFKDRTLVYKNESLDSVLFDLGRRDVTSVLIEGGGEILGQALDSRLIDKVQIYVGASLTGGSTLAFAGLGSATTSEAAHLERVSYTKLGGGTICVTGYPVFQS